MISDLVFGADVWCILHHVPSPSRLDGCPDQIWKETVLQLLKLNLQFPIPGMLTRY